jgi:hypothetical protein
MDNYEGRRTALQSPQALQNQWWRLGGFAGIIFVIIFLVGVIGLQGDTPMPDDSPADIRSYFSDHGRRYMVGDFLIGFGFIFFFLPFASVLRSYLGLAEGPLALWSRLVFAGALLFTAVGASSSGIQGALAYSRGTFTDDNLLKTAIDINYYTFATAVPFTAALMVLSASIIIWRTGALWRWLGALGFAFTIVAIISSLAVLNRDPMSAFGLLGLIAFISLGVWILAASAGLLARRVPPELVF